MRIKKTSQYIEGGASLSNVYGTSDSNGYTQEYINGTVLYEDSTGSNSNITLNDTYTNYRYLEIFGSRYDKSFYTKIPTTKSQFTMSMQRIVDNAFHYYMYEGTFNGTTLTNNGSNHITISTTATINVDNAIVINKVIGYK